MRIYFFFLLIHMVASAMVECDPRYQHTPTYDNYRKGIFTGTFFVPETFISSTDCEPIQNDQYRKYINENFMCLGDWCRDNAYKCRKGWDPECYHVEHIIDKKNSIGSDDDPAKDIIGNRVMAYSEWNMELGKLCWEYVEAEKREIYGDIFRQAEENVYGCIPSARKSDTNYVDWGIGGSIIVLVGVLIMWFILVKRRHNSNVSSIPIRESLSDSDTPDVEEFPLEEI